MRLRQQLLVVVLSWPLIAGSSPLSSVADSDLARILGFADQIAEHSELRIAVRLFSIPARIDECWRDIDTCPDVDLYVAVRENEMYTEPVLYKLPVAKGWAFGDWLEGREKDGIWYVGFTVSTTLPRANIEPKARSEWTPKSYEVWVSMSGAEYELYGA